MAKNVPNELKFGPSMYFYEFYQILEDFGKILKIGRFLAEKRSFNAFFSRCDFETFFSTEIVSGPSKMLRFGWKSVYLLPIMCLTKVTYRFWMILSFGNFMVVQSCREGRFWSKWAKNDQKWPPRQLWRPIKSQKFKIIQNPSPLALLLNT